MKVVFDQYLPLAICAWRGTDKTIRGMWNMMVSREPCVSQPSGSQSLTSSHATPGTPRPEQQTPVRNLAATPVLQVLDSWAQSGRLPNAGLGMLYFLV